MRVPDLQDLYDKTPVTRIQVDGKVEAAAASAELQSILDNKDNELRTLSDAALTDSASALMVKLKAFVASDPAILRAYFTPHDEAPLLKFLPQKIPTRLCLTPPRLHKPLPTSSLASRRHTTILEQHRGTQTPLLAQRTSM